MPLRIKISTKNRYRNRISMEPKKKVFIVCEGDKTEVKYFEGLKNNAKELGINKLVEIIVMEKTSEYKGTSDPFKLVKLVQKKKKSFECNQDLSIYDKKRDKFIIVIDRDKESFNNYGGFINKYNNEFIIAVTNPCFELWLLLHLENSVEDIIIPQKEKVLSNRRISNNHTFISDIVSEKFHMNPKSGMRFSKFKPKVYCAIEQEKKLEQNINNLENNIGSNVGQIIKKEMIQDYCAL